MCEALAWFKVKTTRKVCSGESSRQARLCIPNGLLSWLPLASGLPFLCFLLNNTPVWTWLYLPCFCRCVVCVLCIYILCLGGFVCSSGDTDTTSEAVCLALSACRGFYWRVWHLCMTFADSHLRAFVTTTGFTPCFSRVFLCFQLPCFQWIRTYNVYGLFPHPSLVLVTQ